MPIYYRCPDAHRPVGGVRTIYRHVDILNRHGIRAFVLHERPGFRCTWFKNETATVYLKPPTNPHRPLPVRALERARRLHTSKPRREMKSALAWTDDDVLVMPEVLALEEVRGTRGPKVILNQNAYLTFSRWPEAVEPDQNPDLDATVRAVIVTSDDTEKYLRAAFPELKLLRSHCSIDPQLFAYREDKRSQIAYMPRKNPRDARQVIELLKIRGALARWDVVAIDGMTEEKTAIVLRESAIFLSFGHPEGFGLPPAEAMLCGCIVIGYHGMGGREYFRPTFGFPIEFGDIQHYVETVENVLDELGRSPTRFRGMTRQASEFVGSEYPPEREEHDVLNIWRTIAPPSAVSIPNGPRS